MEMMIEPYVGIGSIRLGMTREEVNEAVGWQPKRFKKSRDADLLSDNFDGFIFVYYREPDVCEAVEVAEPAVPIFRGQRLLETPFAELLRWFKTIDETLETDSTGLTSKKYGIGLYAPDAEDEPDKPAEGVIVFEEDYYDT